MGWTHNWRRQVELPAPEFAAASRDAQAAISTIKITLAGPDPASGPVFSTERIAFNGLPGCEPFDFRRLQPDRHGRRPTWSFCKTEHLPYDICVQATLIILKHHLGDLISIGSDGTDRDWDGARAAVMEAVGYGEAFQLDPSEEA